MNQNFEKRQVSLRYWLLGRQYFVALKAMECGAKYHTGKRKDGFTPEFDHQICMGHFVRTLPDLLFPEETLATVFLHDVQEDYEPFAFDQMRADFGQRIGNAVEVVTKTIPSMKATKNPALMFKEIGEDPIASIAKGADRLHNFGSMVGVFSLAKQKEYLDEGEEFFFPMLKAARRTFPQQERAYELIKHALRGQIDLIRAIHAAHQSGS
jgi:(p)ppGpp synthase/HD superfamily hydrolase